MSSLVKTYFDAANARNLEGILACYASEADRERRVAIYNNVNTAFPDVKEAVSDIVESGDTVSFNIRMTGTHKGMLGQHHPATGKKIDITAHITWKLAGGKILNSDASAVMTPLILKAIE